MDRLRPRKRSVFSGFTDTEIEKLERLFAESGGKSLNRDFCQKIAQRFSRYAERAGKPIVKWTEVHTWFHNRRQACLVEMSPPSIHHKELTPSPDCCKSRVASEQKKANETNQVPKELGEKLPDLSELEFEARSSTDGAWYDVERFLTHRFISSGEAQVLVRFVGFEAEDDEWINVKNDVRERSIPLENWECRKVKVGDVILCLQERKDQAVYYDAHIVEIQRKMHDIRGCRCIFLIQYDHDKSEVQVDLTPKLTRQELLRDRVFHCGKCRNGFV